jgi:hypothetical protein
MLIVVERSRIVMHRSWRAPAARWTVNEAYETQGRFLPEIPCSVLLILDGVAAHGRRRRAGVLDWFEGLGRFGARFERASVVKTIHRQHSLGREGQCPRAVPAGGRESSDPCLLRLLRTGRGGTFMKRKTSAGPTWKGMLAMTRQDRGLGDGRPLLYLGMGSILLTRAHRRLQRA